MWAGRFGVTQVSSWCCNGAFSSWVWTPFVLLMECLLWLIIVFATGNTHTHTHTHSRCNNLLWSMTTTLSLFSTWLYGTISPMGPKCNQQDYSEVGFFSFSLLESSFLQVWCSEQSDLCRNRILLNNNLINAETERHLIKTTRADSLYLAGICGWFNICVYIGVYIQFPVCVCGCVFVCGWVCVHYALEEGL